MNALSSVVEFRSLESGEHIQRVKYLTKLLLKYVKTEYPEYELTDESVNLIVNASALHDLGKIAIPDSILLKPGRLTDEEFKEMKKHTVYGCQLLENFKQEENEFYGYCYDICRHHHDYRTQCIHQEFIVAFQLFLALAKLPGTLFQLPLDIHSVLEQFNDILRTAHNHLRIKRFVNDIGNPVFIGLNFT